MTTTLAFPEPLWNQLVEALAGSDEAAGILVARKAGGLADTTLFARSIHWAPDEAYRSRDPHQLELESSGWVPAMRSAGAEQSIGLLVHTHPASGPGFSARDDLVDAALRPVFTSHTGGYGSIILAGTTNRPQVAARILTREGELPVDVIRVAGGHLTVKHSDAGDTGPVWDRNERAFGREGQLVLRRLRVGIVGGGGTGSAVAEQLIRIGVGHLVVVDDDVVSDSSVTRGYGSGFVDIGQAKVDVLKALADRIGLGTSVTPVLGNLRKLEVAQQFVHCDVVFGCADGHAARLILNRMAYWNLMPVIDIGVLIGRDIANQAQINGRITWLSPGAPCLLCRGRIDPHQAWAEQLNPNDRRALAGQGYVPDGDTPQPAVVAYTTLAASLGVSELLNRLFRLADPAPTETLALINQRALRNNTRPPRPGCFCGDPQKWGQGTQEPYLDLIWPRT